MQLPILRMMTTVNPELDSVNSYDFEHVLSFGKGCKVDYLSFQKKIDLIQKQAV